MICMECGGEMVPTSEPTSFDVRGESFDVKGVRHYVCNSCGNEEFGAAEADELQKKANEAYAARHNMLSPAEIKETRKKYHLNQQQFEKLIGAGKTSMSRWENGSVLPLDSVNKLIRIIRDNPEVYAQLAELAELSVDVSVCGEIRFECPTACAIRHKRMSSLRLEDYELEVIA